MKLEDLNGCPKGLARKVELTAVRSDECADTRNAWITAAEIGTGEQAMCEVFVAQIRELEVLTNTRVVHAGDRVTLSIQGYDAHHNVFNTLSGLPFVWMNEADHIVRRVSLIESGVAFSAQDSASLVVEGILCGVSQITVALDDPSHPSLKVSIYITVVEPISMFPSDFTVFPCAEIQYKLFVGAYETSIIPRDQLKLSDNFQPSPKMLSLHISKPIVLPSFYNFSSTRPDVVSILQREGLATTRMLGRALITVRDTRLPIGTPWIGAQAEILVRQPASLQLIFYGPNEQSVEGSWAFVAGVSYIVKLQLVDQDGHAMIDANNLKYEFTSELPFTILNHSHYVVEATTVGKQTYVAVHLDSIQAADTCKIQLNFSVVQSVVVVAPVVIDPSFAVLLPFSLLLPRLSFLASGGSGEYSWNYLSFDFKQNPLFLSTLNIVEPASFFLEAADIHNRDNHDSISVEVVRATNLFFIDGPREIPVGQTLLLVLAVSANDRAFTFCDNLVPTFDYDESIAILSVSDCSRACQSCKSSWNVTIVSKSVAFSKLVANLGLLRAEVTVQIFTPFSVSPPEVLVAVKHSNVVAVLGGPAVWNSTRQLYLKANFDISLVYNAKDLLLTITCNEVHVKNYSICLQNTRSKENPEPMPSCTHLMIRCVPPLQVAKRFVQIPVGKSMQLAIVNHELSNVVWSIVGNYSIASITEHGMLLGLQLGFTSARVQVLHPSLDGSNLHGLSQICNVSVAFEDFVILNDTYTLIQHQSTLISLIGANGESPADPCFGSVAVEWSVKEGSIAIASPISSNETVVIGPSLRITALVPGIALIQASVIVNFPMFAVFIKLLTLRVLPPLKLLSDALVVLFPFGTTQIRTSYTSDVHYTLLKADESNAFVDAGGKIVAGDKEENIVVVVSAHGQVLFVSVSIAKPSHFLLSIANQSICIGSSFSFSVFLADRVNRLFTESANITSKLNDTQVALQLSKGKVDLFAMHAGSVTVGFYYDMVVPAFISFSVLDCEVKAVALSVIYVIAKGAREEFAALLQAPLENVQLALEDPSSTRMEFHLLLAVETDVVQLLQRVSYFKGVCLDYATVQLKGTVSWNFKKHDELSGKDRLEKSKGTFNSFSWIFIASFLIGLIGIAIYLSQENGTAQFRAIQSRGPGAHARFSHPNNDEFQT